MPWTQAPTALALIVGGSERAAKAICRDVCRALRTLAIRWWFGAEVSMSACKLSKLSKNHELMVMLQSVRVRTHRQPERESSYAC